jgi:xanthine dehydrogenase molybdopterin binding subunit
MSVHLLHESAVGHVTGEALYIDDLPHPERLLVGRVVSSPHAHARIVSFDLTAARAVPGVHAVLSARDIPGENQVGPVVHDELLLAEDEVTFAGQGVFLVAAETEEQCRIAERAIVVLYDQLEAVLDLPAAMAAGALMGPPRRILRGDPVAAIRNAPYRISGELETGAQEHWYLETQAALCVPAEDQRMNVFSSTQHPSETQALVAGVLGLPRNAVEVEVRRLGGAFGGKETQANHTACHAAVLAHATGRPVKIRLFRDDDMIMTGKRHRFLSRYEAGFDGEGMVQGVVIELNSDGGAATDLSFAILERAMLHADNSYFTPSFSVTGSVWKTHLPSNTAFRGFGGPQGMAVMETIVDRIARTLGRDPAEIRRKNFYREAPADTTHYGQVVEDNRLALLYDRIIASSDYKKRRAAAAGFNAENEFVRRGIALTPVKFGISFTTTFLNQAGALVHIYTDGTVLVSHGGVEMGQGLHTKIRGIAAAELGIDHERVRVGATNTARVPNTSATAASSGADLNGMAVKNAIEAIKARISAALAEKLSAGDGQAPTRAADLQFASGSITDSRHPERTILFEEAVRWLYLQRVSLSATGYYSTPGIGWDRDAGRGKPFMYFAFGMAVSEVAVDLLTGAHAVERVDILHDAGDPLNPAIDRGQVEGGFVQGMGWCTTEEVLWDTRGMLMTHSPDTYKIPTAGDVPADFRVALLEGAPNPHAVRNSKAVGEPPFMLALSVWLAVKDALSSITDHRVEPQFSLPATRERIVLEAERLRRLV